MGNIDAALIAYKRKHEHDHPGHRAIMYGNFVECATCKQHAHYYKRGVMVEHGADPNAYKNVEVAC